MLSSRIGLKEMLLLLADIALIAALIVIGFLI